MTTDPTLDAIAAELCVVPPARFTAARQARAAVSDPALARRIRALRKPTAAAWAVNLLAAHGELGEAIELSRELHEAQDDRDASELARLGAQRRALVTTLGRQAAALAAEQGVTLSAAARDEVEKTVNAAVRDAAAAAAVLSGRLVRTLEATGVEGVDLAGALDGSDAVAAASPASPHRDDLAERRARRAAEAAAREAERAASEARRELVRAEAAAGTARDRAAHLRERAGELREELSRVEAQRVAAEAEAERLEERRRDAAARVRETERAARQRALDAPSSGL